jgi:hypothetical protein
MADLGGKGDIFSVLSRARRAVLSYREADRVGSHRDSLFDEAIVSLLLKVPGI